MFFPSVTAVIRNCWLLVRESVRCVTYVYCTVHHCKCWRIKDQLDVTSYFISLHMYSTRFGHLYIHHQELTTVLLNYHIVRFVLGSLCVGDLVQLGLSGVRVAGWSFLQPATHFRKTQVFWWHSTDLMHRDSICLHSFDILDLLTVQDLCLSHVTESACETCLDYALNSSDREVAYT